MTTAISLLIEKAKSVPVKIPLPKKICIISAALNTLYRHTAMVLDPFPISRLARQLF